MPDPLLTIDDATREFRVSPKTVRRRLTAGEIEGAYKRPGTRGPEWVIPRASLVAAGFVARDGVEPASLPEDEGARADYWARRALDAEAALRAASVGNAPPPPARRSGRGVVLAASLVLVALLVGLVVGRAAGGDDPSAGGSGSTAAVTSLLASRTGEGDRVGHVGPEAAAAIPEGRRPVAVEELTDARDLRYVLVAGRASARPIVRQLEDGARAILRLPAEGVVVFDTALSPTPGDGTDGLAPDGEASDEASGSPSNGSGVVDAPLAEPRDDQKGSRAAGPHVGDPPGPPAAGRGASPGGGDRGATAPPGAGPVVPTVEPQGGGSPAPTSLDGERIVAAGESFWTIAEDLAAERGADVTATWSALVDANADRLVQPGNADLLHVGQAIAVPTLP